MHLFFVLEWSIAVARYEFDFDRAPPTFVLIVQRPVSGGGGSRVSRPSVLRTVARPSNAFAILVSTSSGVSNPSTVESRAASALASALPRAASRAAVVTASRMRSSSPPPKKCRRPTAGRTRSGRWRLPWRPAAPRWRRLDLRARRPALRRTRRSGEHWPPWCRPPAA